MIFFTSIRRYTRFDCDWSSDVCVSDLAGPFAGALSRLQVSPSLGDWQFVSGLADWRRYFFARPFTLAVRGVFFGRYGRDANQFQTFLGSTELIRGYTAGSLINNECAQGAPATGVTGGPDLDPLIGSKIA